MGNKKKNTNCQHKNQNNASNWGKNIRRFIIVMIFIVAIISVIQDLIGNNEIKNNGKITTGWVYDKGTGRRSNNIRHYYFFVNGEKYRGMSSSDEELNVGDQIKVVYYPGNPNINRSWKSYVEILKDN